MYLLFHLFQSLSRLRAGEPRLCLHALQTVVDGGQIGDVSDLRQERDHSMDDKLDLLGRYWSIGRAVHARQRVSKVLRKLRGMLSMLGRPSYLQGP